MIVDNGCCCCHSFDTAFYVFNVVANFAYARWQYMYPEMLQEIKDRERKYEREVQGVDAQALSILQV